MKYSLLAVTAALAISLTACGGSGASNPLNPSSNQGFFRFVNGSNDSGAVDVYIDGTKQFSDETYGAITNFQSVSPGAHTIAIYATGTTTPIAGVPSSTLSQSVNANQYVSLVLAGEQKPIIVTNTPTLFAISSTSPYSTSSGGAAAKFYNAYQPGGSTQLSINSTGASQNLGGPITPGATTGPQGIPSSFLSSSVQVTFTATPTTGTAASLQPSTVSSSSCSANTLPCNTGNLTLYMIDGPGATATPTTSGTNVDALVGFFDNNGT